MALEQEEEVALRPGDTAAASERHAAARAAIARTQAYLLSTQAPEGWWCGELESNVTITAEYLFLTHFLGVANQAPSAAGACGNRVPALSPAARAPARWAKIAAYIRDQQRDDGTWGIYYDAPGDLSTTIEAYFALKLAGTSPDEPAMQRARAFILDKGGVPKARIFTKIWLALLGQYDWRGLPVMPPELIFLPSWCPFNIYDFACWARETIVPMLILLTERPTRPVPPEAAVDELYCRPADRLNWRLPKKSASLLSWRRFFLGADAVLRRLERGRWKPLRQAARRACERWIIAHQEADGSWGGIQPPWVYSLLALHVLGHPVSDAVMAKGLRGFEDFAIEDERTFRTQSCMSPVWDTCLAVTALLDSGLPPDDPALVRAGRWLLSEQIFSGGDWQVKQKGWQRPARPGGWAFEFQNDLYPDTDDTAEVLLALRRITLPPEEKERQVVALERGTEWLLGMQSQNGGFASFDIDNTRQSITQIPFCDFGEVIDPPSEDVTAHILEWFGALGVSRADQQIAWALRYLKREQQADGSWWGRWGVNYIYGTGAVLPALRALDEDMRQPSIQQAANWLLSCQQDDGGWGETCGSYDSPAPTAAGACGNRVPAFSPAARAPAQRGTGAATASQTAWALLGLLAVKQGSAADARMDAAIERGIAYLVAHQEPDGTWTEPYFTGTGFPRAFMIKYHLYRIYFPLMALGRYLERA